MSVPTLNIDPDELKTVKVKVTPRQLAWLQRTADEQNLSVDHVLRSIITNQIRSETGRVRPGSGDEHPQPSEHRSTGVTGRPPEGAEADNSPSSSIVDSLRSASEHLEDLTEDDIEADPSDLSDTLARLQARLEADGDSDASPGEQEGSTSGLLDRQNRSMFDLVEEE